MRKPNGHRRYIAAKFRDSLSRMVNVLGATRYNPTPRKSAAEALHDDWAKLGGDMRRAAANITQIKR